jgi:hypothetical protein
MICSTVMGARIRLVAFGVLLLSWTVLAQKENEYRTGRLLSVTDATDAEQPSKTASLLHIQDGAEDYFALYSVIHPFYVLRHDQSDSLKPEGDILYRVSGKNLFVKIADGKEIKAHLCEKINFRGMPGVKCGGLTVFGPGADSQTKQTPSEAHP